MSATIVARSESSFTVQVEIPYGSSMLDFEQTIQERLNQAGVVATQEALQQFDTDGSPITVGPVKFTSKGQLPKDYQTPYYYSVTFHKLLMGLDLCHRPEHQMLTAACLLPHENPRKQGL